MAKKEWHSFRALSKVDYGSKVDADNIESAMFDPVAKGAVLRIADAQEVRSKQYEKHLEIMERRTQAIEAQAKDKIALLHQVRELTLELDKLKEKEKRTEEYWRNAQTYGAKMERSRNGLRGYVAKLEKKLAVK